MTRDHMRARLGPFTTQEQRAAELELANLHADAFALNRRTAENEDPPTLEEWGTHYRRKAPLLVRLSLSDPLRYEDPARDAVTKWREAEQLEVTAIAAIGTGDDAERWLSSRPAD
jgi:DhnA family fructose-bisphosphate aldolase class Ia